MACSKVVCSDGRSRERQGAKPKENRSAWSIRTGRALAPQFEFAVTCSGEIVPLRQARTLGSVTRVAAASREHQRLGRKRPLKRIALTVIDPNCISVALHRDAPPTRPRNASQFMREFHDHAGDREVCRILVDVPHETAVDLDDVRFNLAQVRERR